MATQKTSTLIGLTLDWAVAKCGGKGIEFEDPRDPWLTCDGIADQPLHSYTPSTDWSQGGPIIEREGINLGTQRDEPGFRWHPDALWHAQLDIRVYISYGPTPLIAAMRCYVASKVGETIDVPDDLTNSDIEAAA